MPRCFAFFFIVIATPVFAAPAQSRFFFSGDGHLLLRHAYFGTAVDVRFRRADGSYDQAALDRLRHLFRSRGDDREGDISLRLIELLDFVDQLLRPKQMILLSGYRSPEFNDELRAAGALAARASLHTQGLAADVMLKGVDLRRAWKRLRELQVGGVGLYEKEHFLHLDTGRPRFWQPQTSRVAENISAGNAQLIARTDFDRYRDLNGAVIELHSVTALPLRIAKQAHLSESGATIELAPLAGVTDDGAGCIEATGPSDHYTVTVVGAPAAASAKRRQRVLLTTCSPRIESTPERLATNEVEIASH